MLARGKVPHRRFVYVPGNLPREWVGEVWRTIQPKETVVTMDDHGMIPPLAIDRVRHRTCEGTAVLHLFASHLPANGTGVKDQAPTISSSSALG
jgi:hypothetical protein